jgi:hypothetical protein
MCVDDGLLLAHLARNMRPKMDATVVSEPIPTWHVTILLFRRGGRSCWHACEAVGKCDARRHSERKRACVTTTLR